MRVAQFEFKPPLWASLVFVLVLALLVVLGSWQVQRGQAKDAIIAERSQLGKMPPVAFAPETQGYGDNQADTQSPNRRVTVAGEYVTGQQLLLDNQVWKSRPGYRVWTPLQLDDGRLLMVDRGWVALSADRNKPPQPMVPGGDQQLVGYWRDWPQPGLRFAPQPCGDGQWPRVLLYPELPQVACNYDAPVLDGLLLLDENAQGGFPRNWQDVGLPPLRHYGYALQWYALALALCAIFIGVNTQKRRG